PTRAGQYCGTYDLLPPVAGDVFVCGPTFRYAFPEISASGTVTLASGIRPYADAERAAREAVDIFYLPRVKFGSDLEIGVIRWAYRPESEYWAFVLRARWKSPVNGPTKDDFSKQVLVRVSKSGSGCVV